MTAQGREKNLGVRWVEISFKVKEMWVYLIFIGLDRQLWKAGDWSDKWEEEMIGQDTEKVRKEWSRYANNQKLSNPNGNNNNIIKWEICSIAQVLGLAFQHSEMRTIHGELYPNTSSIHVCKKVNDIKWLQTQVVWFFSTDSECETWSS